MKEGSTPRKGNSPLRKNTDLELAVVNNKYSTGATSSMLRKQATFTNDRVKNQSNLSSKVSNNNPSDLDIANNK